MQIEFVLNILRGKVKRLKRLVVLEQLVDKGILILRQTMMIEERPAEIDYKCSEMRKKHPEANIVWDAMRALIDAEKY